MMETEIICSYACLEPFDNESKVPCVLKCGHTYCQSCIRQLVSKTCPACRRVFSGYTTNFALLDIISSNKKTTNNQDDLEKIFKDFETLKISHSIESYEKEISKILQNQSLENDYIATKIKLKFTVDDLDSKLFICALVKSVHRICLDPKNKLSESKFKRYASLLKIFVSRNREFKLDALLALRANDNLRLIAKIFVEENVLNKNDINEFSNIVNIITQSSKDSPKNTQNLLDSIKRSLPVSGDCPYCFKYFKGLKIHFNSCFKKKHSTEITRRNYFD